MVLGSGRALLDDPERLSTYRSGDRPPLLLGNLGAAQVRRPDAPERAERLVALLEADGLTVHLNPIQEAVQPEGEPDFAGVAAGIAAVVERLAPLPVVVKEVGFGMDAADVALLRDAGVAAIDVAGAGGTNWALVEGRRDERAGDVASAFADWGVPTADALIEARRHRAGPAGDRQSGGLRDGVDAAKALALGASAAGLARPFLLGRPGRHDLARRLHLDPPAARGGLGGRRGLRGRAVARPPARLSVCWAAWRSASSSPRTAGAARLSPEGLHVLETFSGEPFSADSGRVVRRRHDGSKKVLASGLNFPVGIAAGNGRRYGDALYVSTVGYGQGPVEGRGRIVRLAQCDSCRHCSRAERSSRARAGTRAAGGRRTSTATGC